MTQHADTPRSDTTTLSRVADWVCAESLLFNDDTSPFRATLAPAAAGLVVVTGENASGKSLWFRVCCAKAQEAGLTPVTVSIRERTGSSPGDMARMRQVFMFGDEHTQSTGAVSARTVATAFKNLDRAEGSLLGLDEPEIGLSDGYARALGQFIGDQARTVPATCVGVVVVTHSRSLVGGLVDGYEQEPTFVALDGQHTSLGSWLAHTESRTVAELLALPETGHARFRLAAALLNSK